MKIWGVGNGLHDPLARQAGIRLETRELAMPVPKVPWDALTMNGTQRQAKTTAFYFIPKFTRTSAPFHPSLLYPWKPVMMLQREDAGQSKEGIVAMEASFQMSFG